MAKDPAERDYAGKRSFDQTPEPPPEVEGDVDVATAPPGSSFVIHQHHARRLHFDLRLEMLNGATPVLVSWAVPKNLPTERGLRALAVKVEDHPSSTAASADPSRPATTEPERCASSTTAPTS
jgi:DNA ligase D-like protein (predicted 3'-phosphoesterase)